MAAPLIALCNRFSSTCMSADAVGDSTRKEGWYDGLTWRMEVVQKIFAGKKRISQWIGYCLHACEWPMTFCGTLRRPPVAAPIRARTV